MFESQSKQIISVAHGIGFDRRCTTSVKMLQALEDVSKSVVSIWRFPVFFRNPLVLDQKDCASFLYSALTSKRFSAL